MKWIAVTSKRRIEIEAKRRFDAEQEALKLLQKGEELYYITTLQHQTPYSFSR